MALGHLERQELIEKFIAIADPYNIPAETLTRWAHAQADDFANWPRRGTTPQRGLVPPTWKSYVGRANVHTGLATRFAQPFWDPSSYYGTVILGNKQLRRPKRKQRPTKREREYAKNK